MNGSVLVSTAVGMGGKAEAAATCATLRSMSTSSNAGEFEICGGGSSSAWR